MRMSRRVKGVLVIVLLALMINLPLATSYATERHVRRSGVDVTATVVGSSTSGSGADVRYVLAFELPEEIDPARSRFPAEVDAATFAAATASGVIRVRVLEDRPTAYLVEGRVVRHGALWTTLVADALLLGLVLLLVRSGRYSASPGTLHLEAIADLSHPDGPSGLEDLGDGTSLVTGTVVETSADEVVLEVAGDRAVVILDGHHNPIPVGAPALARGRLLES